MNPDLEHGPDQSADVYEVDNRIEPESTYRRERPAAKREAAEETDDDTVDCDHFLSWYWGEYAGHLLIWWMAVRIVNWLTLGIHGELINCLFLGPAIWKLAIVTRKVYRCRSHGRYLYTYKRWQENLY